MTTELDRVAETPLDELARMLRERGIETVIERFGSYEDPREGDWHLRMKRHKTDFLAFEERGGIELRNAPLTVPEAADAIERYVRESK